jgi:MerR family mercuric resistance operon transcriptional regulator
MSAEIAAESLTIGRLAQVGGVNLETVRYYEREGLLPKPPRTASGYRLFPPEAVRRLRFIKRAQELGFSLTEIRELLSLRMRQHTRHADVRSRAQAKIVDIDQKIRTLQRMKRALRTLTDRCEACAPNAACPILENFEENGEPQ